MLANGHSHPAAQQKFPTLFRWWHKWLFLAVALMTAGAVIAVARLLK